MAIRKNIFLNINSPKNTEAEITEINQWLHVQSKKTNTVSLIHYCIARFGNVDLLSDRTMSELHEPSLSDELFHKVITKPECTDFENMKVNDNLYIRYEKRSDEEINEINRWIDSQSYIGFSIKLAIRLFINKFGYRDIEDVEVSKWLYIGLHFDQLVANDVLTEEQATYLYLANSKNVTSLKVPNDFSIAISNDSIPVEEVTTSSVAQTNEETTSSERPSARSSVVEDTKPLDNKESTTPKPSTSIVIDPNDF